MKKGFTLIELLAVIAVLAIIALIATPVVLNIISESKDSVSLESAEMYLKAVNNAMSLAELEGNNILDNTYQITSKGNICLETYDSETNTCKDNDGISDNNELIIEAIGVRPSSGSITIKNGNIKYVSIKLNNKTIVNNENGKLVYSICELVKDNGETGITLGDEYICEVKPGTKYTFFVLSYSDKEGNITDDPSKAESTNLIMDRNICIDGIPETEDNKCPIVWGLLGDKSTGPFISMAGLAGTKDWINIPLLSFEYYDSEWQNSLFEGDYDGGYDSVTFKEGKVKIDMGVLVTDSSMIVRARMPIYTKINGVEYGEVRNFDGTNGYLYKNIPNGYWTLSSAFNDDDKGAYAVDSNGISVVIDQSLPDGDMYVENGQISEKYMFSGNYGVRPVINVKL